MEIEIVTTKKKLTLAVLKQIYELPYSLFEKAEILGFLNVRCSSADQNALCKVENEYYTLNMRWKRHFDVVDHADHNCGKNNRKYRRKIDSKVIDDWFEKYDKIVKEAEEKGQIYI